MARRLRREFQALEAQFEPGAQEKAWKDLIDKALYDKGPGPRPIVEQLRLRERLKTLHARRDRYNQKRYEKKLKALLPLYDHRHVIASMAIGFGIVEASEGPFPRDLIIGALAGDFRLTKKLLNELEGIHEALHPPVLPWESDQERIRWEKQATITTRSERHDFEESLKPTPVPAAAPAPINLGFEIPLPGEAHAPDHHINPAAARAAS